MYLRYGHPFVEHALYSSSSDPLDMQFATPRL
jgi:hypothetical protein